MNPNVLCITDLKSSLLSFVKYKKTKHEALINVRVKHITIYNLDIYCLSSISSDAIIIKASAFLAIIFATGMPSVFSNRPPLIVPSKILKKTCQASGNRIQLECLCLLGSLVKVAGCFWVFPELIWLVRVGFSAGGDVAGRKKAASFEAAVVGWNGGGSSGLSGVVLAGLF
ncbi:hypothetical protein [Persicirhabdus sediminis]|uniref:Uncharacterized protein n=1 Tax=Persicirhabdus sediminis TaxID=454144 RepID=A0A8J7SHL8_9BACT|nr:hypothetical protein [Persicirhabdus sediminis]MBK1790875.1 hypothetical protein [Persicirhabdus sediminis]